MQTVIYLNCLTITSASGGKFLISLLSCNTVLVPSIGRRSIASNLLSMILECLERSSSAFFFVLKKTLALTTQINVRVLKLPDS